MPRISKTLSQRHRRIIKRSEVPTWWGMFMGGLGVLLALWIAWGLITDGGKTGQRDAAATTAYTIETAPLGSTQVVQETVTTPAVDTTGPGTTQTIAIVGTTIVKTTLGSDVEVPAAAVAVVTAQAKQDGGTTAVLVEILLRTKNGEALYFDARIDPDGNGAGPSTVLLYRTYPLGAQWAVERA